MPTALPITDRPVRVAVVGLGTIAELALPPYRDRDDVEVVGLCDHDPARVARWQSVWPDALGTGDLGAILAGDADVVDVLVPTPSHAEVVCAVLDAGFHVQVQKPIATNLETAQAMIDYAVKGLAPSAPVWVAIAHANDPRGAAELADRLRSRVNVRYTLTRPFCATTYINIGPGGLGLFVGCAAGDSAMAVVIGVDTRKGE